MLERGKLWDFPPSDWEAALCEELKDCDIVTVQRMPSEQLAWMRMPKNDCHANARWYEENDPHKKSRRVTGWWIQWPEFLLHSVIEVEGHLACITPSMFGEVEFPFIPDAKISWKVDGDRYSAVRNGQVIGPGIRAFPSYTIARGAIVRERLLAGIDPRKAVEFSESEMADLKRRYVPPFA